MKKIYTRSFNNIQSFVKNIDEEMLYIVPVNNMVRYINNSIYCRYVESNNCVAIAKIHFNNKISNKVQEKIDEGDFTIEDVIEMMKHCEDSFAMIYRVAYDGVKDTERLIKFLIECGDISREEIRRREKIRRIRKELRKHNLSCNSKEVKHYIHVEHLYYEWKHSYVEIPNKWEGLYEGKFDHMFEKVRNPIDPNRKVTYYYPAFFGDDWNRDGYERGVGWED